MLLLLNVKTFERFVKMKHLLLATAILPGVFYLILAFTNNIIIVLAAILIITNSKIIRKPILADYINKHIESHNRATVLSSISLIERMMIFLLYPIIGLLADFNLTCTLVFLGIATIAFGIITKLEEHHLKAAER
jgi:hypothetical protein